MKTDDTRSNHSAIAVRRYPELNPVQKAKWALLLLILPFVLAKVENVAADDVPFFREDFEDGAASDGQPVTWAPSGTAVTTSSVEEGWFVSTTESGRANTLVEEFDSIDNVSIRATVRGLSTEPSTIILYARVQPDSRSYFAGISQYGLVLAIVPDGENYEFVSTKIDLSFNPFKGKDFNLQFDVEGDVLSLTAWQSGESKPASPQITGTAPIALPPGKVGFGSSAEKFAIDNFDAIQIGNSPAPTLIWKSVGQNKLQFNIPQGHVLQTRPNLDSLQWTDMEGSGTIEVGTTEATAFFQLRSQ